jgi:hypothetical protein
MFHRTLRILLISPFLFGIPCVLADQKLPSDRTYIAFYSAPFVITDSGLKEFSCFEHRYDEVSENVYSFAPITVSFNSKPLIFDAGYVKTEVPYIESSLGVRVFGVGPYNFYGSFLFGYGSTGRSYEEHWASENYGGYYSTSFEYSEKLITGGVTLKFPYNKKFDARLFIGYGFRLFEENGVHNKYYWGFSDGEDYSGSSRKPFYLDTKLKTIEISARSVIGLYDPFGIFFNFNVLTGRLENTEIVRPRRITALFGVSCII